MKFSVPKLSFGDAAIAGAVLVLCGVLLSQNSANPIQVALLRWYQGNQVVTFNTCSGPGGLAFDGTHMWVACDGAGDLEEFNASDGKLVATVTQVFSGTYAGTTPGNLLYDGANIWATNGSTSAGAVARVSVAGVNGDATCSTPNGCQCSSLNANCANIATGSGPFAMTFDGNVVWVSNYNSNNLTKIPANGNPSTYTLPSSCTTPLGLAYDKTYVWVACSGTNGVLITNSAQKFVSTGDTVGAVSIAFDGGNMWVTSASNASKVYEISTTSPYSVTPFTMSNGAGPVGFDGKYIWVGNYSNGKVTKFAGGSQLVFNAGSNPSVVAFDGGNIWVTNHGSNTVQKF